MILFAPNVFVARYLKETAQMKPEVMAKAESLMMTGYQRELTYRRSDGSFSAFGQSDKEGSLWLTSFVLKTFAQAKDLIYVDDAVQSAGRSWIAKRRKPTARSRLSVSSITRSSSADSGNGARRVRRGRAQRDGRDSAFGKAIRTTSRARWTPPRSRANIRLCGSCEKSAKRKCRRPASQLARSPTSALGDDPLRSTTKRRPQPDRVSSADGRQPERRDRTTGYALLALLVAGTSSSASRAALARVAEECPGGFGSTRTLSSACGADLYASNSRAASTPRCRSRRAAGLRMRRSPEQRGRSPTVELPSGGVLTVGAAGPGRPADSPRYNVREERPAAIFDLKVDYTADRVAI
jgi:hypothetical protein